MAPQIFPCLGPALMISMGYIDLGNGWQHLLPLVIFLNCCAIFCQYLATSVGVATENNLAQQRVLRSVCIMLGLQAEISAIALDISTILGVAHGISILSALDIVTSILLAMFVAVVLPFSLPIGRSVVPRYLRFCTAVLCARVLISQPEIPLSFNGIFPKLSGETAYSVMALLGSNIMVHNFYTHSSAVQRQKRLLNVSVDALRHDHFFAVLFVFSGIFLVNYVLVNSAASVVNNSGIIVSTFQDAFLLLDQVFKVPIPPIASVLVLLFSSLVTAFSWNIGGRVILRDLLHLSFPPLVHQVLVRTLAAILAFCCAQSTGAEGIYQLLVFCQVVSAVLLPSSVIPLFRVASSRPLMGSSKISWQLEILALLTFFGILASNILFSMELLFGNSSWITTLRGGAGDSFSLQFILILSIACVSLVLTLYLAVTPLKSASHVQDFQMWASQLPVDHPQLAPDVVEQEEGEEKEEGMIKPRQNDDASSVVGLEEPLFMRSLGIQPDQLVSESDFDLPNLAIDADQYSQQPVPIPDLAPLPSPESDQEHSIIDSDQISLQEVTDEASPVSVLDLEDAHEIISKGSIDRSVHVEPQKQAENNSEGTALDCSLPKPAAASKVPREKAEVPSSGPGSIPKTSGLGRSARRTFASILDEFWDGRSSSKRGDLPQRTLQEAALPEATRGLVSPKNPRDYSPPMQQRSHVMGSSSLGQMGSPSWSSSLQLLNSLGQSSWNGNPSEASERRYSSLRLPQNSSNWDYQPATIHGHQISSYIRGLGASRYSNPTHIPLEEPDRKSAEFFSPSYKDPFAYNQDETRFSSLTSSGLQSLNLSRPKLQAEGPYYESPLPGSMENGSSATYTKKYHSLPDISGITIAARAAHPSDRNNTLWGGPVSSRVPIGRMASGHLQYSKGEEGGALLFNDLSSSGLYGVSSMESNPILSTKSLWSREPFEQFFGVESKAQSQERPAPDSMNSVPEEAFSYADSEITTLRSLKACILKILKLEGSDWLFRQDGGADVGIIDQLAAKERFLSELSSGQTLSSASSNSEMDVPNCGESCIWRMSLVVNFGVWCVLRILELSHLESRPELWGKYTYVLNRLQGILQLAFSRPRSTPKPAPVSTSPRHSRSRTRPPAEWDPACGRNRAGNMHVSHQGARDHQGRRGRHLRPQGPDRHSRRRHRLPKGKENLASVLKRYKRHLATKPPPPSFHEVSPRPAGSL
ncbi:unnamed protein product [Spirodela intermedia]|uniref:Uncharacterized protein n=1 Tax=Spirodela intermedia TaxID=51605 RepID=A0A7I8JNN8_SPIIN|nr:unnamed protein product [Spirodela intermedia]CAA6671759.1 unnamed protein product [Spirodela intermedia]